MLKQPSPLTSLVQDPFRGIRGAIDIAPGHTWCQGHQSHYDLVFSSIFLHSSLINTGNLQENSCFLCSYPDLVHFSLLNVLFVYLSVYFPRCLRTISRDSKCLFVCCLWTAPIMVVWFMKFLTSFWKICFNISLCSIFLLPLYWKKSQGLLKSC